MFLVNVEVFWSSVLRQVMEQAADWMVGRMEPDAGAREYLEAAFAGEGVSIELLGAPSVAQAVTRTCGAAEFTCPVPESAVTL